VLPAWSPDGKKIAFQSTPISVDAWEIYTINADGTGEKALTNNQMYGSLPDWSPDGQRIVFNGFTGIHVINADGKGLRPLQGGTDPAWSPDGKKIAFRGADERGDDEIATMNPDGSGRTARFL